MGSCNADRQHRQRPSARGLAHGQGWVKLEQAEAIRRILRAASGRGVPPRAEKRAEQNDS